jgi:hypothetical protein
VWGGKSHQKRKADKADDSVAPLDKKQKVYDEDVMIEVIGIDGYSVMLSKKSILSHPQTLLAEILINDHTATTINLHLDRVQLDLIASFFNSSLDLVSFYENNYRQTINYVAVPKCKVNHEISKLISHLVANIDPQDAGEDDFEAIKGNVEKLKNAMDELKELRDFENKTGTKLEKLIPEVKMKSVSSQTFKSECGIYRSRYIPLHQGTQNSYTFVSEYGDGKEVEILEQTVESTGALPCHGTSKCSLHGMSVNGDLVVEYAPRPTFDWGDYDPEDHGEEVGAQKRIQDESIPSYFLKEWRTAVAILDVEPLRKHLLIHSDIGDDVLARWLEQSSEGPWVIEWEESDDEAGK